MATMIARRRWRALALPLSLVGACSCPDGSTAAGRAYSGNRSASGAPAAAADDNDRVAILNGPTPSVVALNGQGRTTCHFGKLLQGSGTIDLQDRMESPSSCASSVAVFARDRAAQVDVMPAWTHNPAAPLELTLQSRIQVPIRFYAPQGTVTLLTAQNEMDMATGWYAANRVGIRFSLAGLDHYAGTPVATSCADVATLVATPGRYDPTVINVYYVQQVNGADLFLGYNCFEHAMTVGGVATTGENIIFLATHRATTTLAHELGHALGLRLQVGHTTTAGGFTIKNLMMGGITWASQNAQDHFSLGQAYRMSFDRSSWINHPPPTKPTGVRTGATRACQPVPTAAAGDQCPALVLDP